MEGQATDQSYLSDVWDMAHNAIDWDDTSYSAQRNMIFKVAEINNVDASFSYRMIRKDTACRLQARKLFSLG